MEIFQTTQKILLLLSRRKELTQKMRAVQVSIRKNAQNKTYHNAAISSIADHLSSVYGLTRGSYPIQSAPTAQISAAKGFVEELNWAKDELEGLNIPDVDGVLNKIEQLARTVYFSK